MTVELWYGKKPENRAEQDVLVDLYDYLRTQPDHYVMLSTFELNHEIDLVVLKASAWFVVEIKHVWGKVIGSKNGDWKCINPNGTVKTLRNPFRQVRDSYFGLRDWVQANLSHVKPAPASGKELDPKRIEPFEYIVLYPNIPDDKEIDIGDHPVHLIDLAKLRAALVMCSVPGLKFTKDELQTVPRLLNLTSWQIDPPPSPPPPQVGNSDAASVLQTSPIVAERSSKLVIDESRITRHFPSDYQPPSVRMLVARGHEYSQQVVHIDQSPLIIGREPDCGLVINHESVSRKHAEIRWDKDRWIVRDFGSRNGVFVAYNGDPSTERRVERFNALKNGSIVRLGQASFTFLLNEGK